jgi:signal transduction histidine kinase
VRLPELLDMAVVQKLAEANYNANGMPLSIIDAFDSSILVRFGWQETCLKFHRVHPGTSARCHASDRYVGKHLSEGQPCEYTCENGLRHIGIPILVTGEHVATLFLSQFFYEGESPDRQFFLDQARQFGFDEKAYFGALARVPVFTRRVVENILIYNQALTRFIADLAERALVHARDEEALRQADRRKTEFLAVLSHELRNPLASVRNSLAVLAHEREGPRAGRAVAVIERQVTHLAGLVDDLLDVSRITTGKIQLHLEHVDLCHVLEATVEDYRSVLAEAGVRLDLELPATSLHVNVDPTRLVQVFGNLLRNAAKFTPAGGRIAVGVEDAHEPGAVRVLVRDSGCGFDEAMRPKLFQPFAQAETTLARTRGGLGLGLALVKALVELHGGAVSARSAGSGKGAEFSFTLPLEPEASSREDAPRAPSGPPRRVLIVEDNEDAALSLRDVLEMAGHEVHIALDGPQGVEMARLVRPDVILCDIGLPGMDGYQVARELQAGAEPCQAQLIALTGYASPDDERLAVEAGFHHHFAKPADLDRLSRILAGSG